MSGYAGPCTVLGGLPLWAECSGGYDSGSPYSPPEYWSEVDTLHWQKKDGTKGKEIPKAVYDKIEKWDEFWQAVVIEQVSDYLSYSEKDNEMVKFND